MNESKLDVKKKAVIEIAENLFLSQGLATTEMKEIARCASISRSTLYRMFDSRETLAFAVADKCLHELFGPKPMEIYGTDRSGFEILRSYSSNLIETMIQGVRYVKYLSEFDQMFSGDYPDTPEARKYVQFNRQRHDRQILLNILRLGTEDGSIRGISTPICWNLPSAIRSLASRSESSHGKKITGRNTAMGGKSFTMSWN